MIYTILLMIQMIVGVNTNFDKIQSENSNGNVIVHVTDIPEIKGEVLVGIYDSRRTWRKVKKVLKYEIKKVEDDREVLVLEDIPAGTYAIAIFQDFNGNRKFDYNWVGVPKEPFGFSTNFMVNNRAPRYKEVTFTHPGDQDTEMEIVMQVW
ncbi:DUF2141 domain-containing protein [Portibacter marinus]|uniref:DUF2141 domain-containing protein n=1 Tax=Portibacter marinus TaxID=2898660 RepID=UPI001F341CFA|nr:DUF2141 domain-containing protein [Portibacter marinus]